MQNKVPKYIKKLIKKNEHEKMNTEDWHYYEDAFTETGFLTQCLNAGMWSDFLCFSHLLNKLSDALLTDEQI